VLKLSNWWRNYDDVLSLAQWLNDRDAFERVSDLLDYFEKPYNWEKEWNIMQKENEIQEKLNEACKNDKSHVQVLSQ